MGADGGLCQHCMFTANSRRATTFLNDVRPYSIRENVSLSLSCDAEK